MKLHKEGQQVVDKEEEEKKDKIPLQKELQTKQRRNPTFLKATTSKFAIDT